MNKQKLVSPDAVRVWRGFRSPKLSEEQFIQKLSQVFIPATVEMQTKAGLNAYLPTVLSGLKEKPSIVPDETAILYWNSKQTYYDAFKTLAVRTYTLTHADVYTTESRADFPLFFQNTILEHQPYYLFDKPADWMQGTVKHLVASRPAQVDMTEYLSRIAEIMGNIQKLNELDGAIICVGSDHLVYWELISAKAGNETQSGIPLLSTYLAWRHATTLTSTSLPKGLWDVWLGMEIKAGNSFNMQFSREHYEY